MGPVRRTINLILALALAAAGSLSLIYLLFYSPGWKGWMLMSTAIMAFGGLSWLWADYINPRPEN